MTDVEEWSFKEPKDIERWLGSSTAPDGKKESDGTLVMVSMVVWNGTEGARGKYVSRIVAEEVAYRPD